VTELTGGKVASVCTSLATCVVNSLPDFKDFKVTSVENTEKCFKTLTSRTKDGEGK
jgi:hypothetical protein